MAELMDEWMINQLSCCLDSMVGGCLVISGDLMMKKWVHMKKQQAERQAGPQMAHIRHNHEGYLTSLQKTHQGQSVRHAGT